MEQSDSIFTIPADRSFVEALAARLLDETGGDVMALADTLILLPTRRACRSLREAFLRLGQGRALVLPGMQPIGDVDEEELVLAGGSGPETAFIETGLSPAIGGLRRQLLLAQLILKRPNPNGELPGPDQAVKLAGELATLLDQVQTELTSLDAIEDLVAAEFSEHWQLTVAFLDILRQFWPAILADEGCLDPADRRNRLLAAQNSAWRQTPPKGRLIAAGSTGSVPATRDLLKTIAGMEGGMVILPGLDRHLDHESWKAVRQDETHPQFGLARLLDHLEISRAKVRDWPKSDLEKPTCASGRVQLISEALRPAETTEAWRKIALEPDGLLAGVSRLDCPTAQLEATAIALMMRQTLETPNQTAALVTPDRTLARRVTAELGRWGLNVDDSAGVPLNASPPVVYLRLLAEAAAREFAPVSLLALLKHPLSSAGLETGPYKRLVRLTEKHLLRGPRPGPGIAGLEARLRSLRDQDAISEERHAELAAFLTGLDRCLAPLAGVMTLPECSLSALLESHLTAAEMLAETDMEHGRDRIWVGEAGEAFLSFVTEVKESAALFDRLVPRDYPSLLENLMLGRAVRPRYGQHPRLFILGPLEARLHQPDLVILGGLNEGIWPPEAKADPWMSRPMRAKLGLPLPEQRIGLSAHDFSQAFGADRVIMTRAEKLDGQPTVPSRWLSRLEVVLQALGLENDLAPQAPWLDWAARLGQATGLPISMPEPRPPVSARPRKLSVTRIEAWMRDPYSIYAGKILSLEPLDPLEAEPGMADRGTFIHAALEAFVQAYPDAMPADAEEKLLAIGEKSFGDSLDQPAVRTFWWPRFQRIAAWFVQQEEARRKEILESHTESWGELILHGEGDPFTLVAKADRIDRMHDDSLAIIDYKTGSPPSDKLVRAGVSPQMPLEAAIAAAGGFGKIRGSDVSTLEYWRLSGGDPAGERKPVKGNAMELAEEAVEGLRSLIERFDKADTPYRPTPRPKYARAYNDFEHLAREKEWRVSGGEDGE
ncbi:double-strand break repair protein AddB [Aestuariispira insulae]|uniref:ATP-dependent helicase/nuclease subunit B n=1 Tax=Aestuariispira insulae TaxID=1461337 RepID=A0A3D9HPH3_9PROT|nr:double-strand break repair protein AddB [Aestuariispira insulae]RED51403.1 ATP-dependent helicase/nuclease subunit B [Aestuariispira insulae]